MKSKKRMRALCVIAACFAVVILAAVVIAPMMFDNDEPLPPVRNDGTNSQAPSENVIPPSTGPSPEYDEMVFPDYAANNPLTLPPWLKPGDSWFSDHCLTAETVKSYTVSPSVRFGRVPPYREYVY